jgi:deazaflavin-dependent oxidoreductase (nitroreductase family)
MKRQVMRVLQKYMLNPPVKLLFVLGLAPPGYALLQTIGRRSGKPRRTPVGNGRLGDQFWIVAEHGRTAGYVLNIERNPQVRVKLRDGLRMRWHSGTAHLLPDDDPRERQRWLAEKLPRSAKNATAVRLFGTQLLTIRIDLDD